jgi:hypothetical protein
MLVDFVIHRWDAMRGYNTTWNNNTFLGFQAGNNNTSGGANSFLGSNTDVSGGQYNYSTAIGYGVKITASNTIPKILS